MGGETAVAEAHLVDAWGLTTKGVAAGLEPDPVLTVSEWADKHRVLSAKAAAEPGPWHTDRTPYLREIMDSLSTRSHVEKVVFMKGSQIGASECGNNFLGYVIHHAPGPFLYVLPTIELARKASRHRIATMIQDCPALAGRVRKAQTRSSENTMLMKEFDGGYMALTGANSSAGLRALAIRYLFCDEVDAYPPDASGEGDPLELSYKRTDTFKGLRKIFICSTPTIKHFSRIEQEFEHTDKRYYEVPCPHCGAFQFITWGQIKFNARDYSEPVMLQCMHCEEMIDEAYKSQMLAEGRWMPTRESSTGTRGYHLSSLYSPSGWYSWRDAAIDQIKSKKKGRESLQVWVNTVLGETWDEEGDAIEADVVMDRCEKYKARVPEEVMVITAGVDVQDDRVEVEVVGWCKDLQTYGIEYRVIHGDPGKMAMWDELDELLESTWTTESGIAIPINCTCVDSGGHYTQAVYNYCRVRTFRRIFAIKGVGGAGKPVVSAPRKGRSGRGRRHADLYYVGADQARGMVYSSLKTEKESGGFCHFPVGHGYTAEYFRQLTSMKSIYKYVKGVPKREWYLLPGRRKEAFDCRIYALAALHILNPAWDRIEKRRSKAAPPPEDPDATPTPPKRRRRRPRSSFVMGR